MTILNQSVLDFGGLKYPSLYLDAGLTASAWLVFLGAVWDSGFYFFKELIRLHTVKWF